MLLVYFFILYALLKSHIFCSHFCSCVKTPKSIYCTVFCSDSCLLCRSCKKNIFCFRLRLLCGSCCIFILLPFGILRTVLKLERDFHYDAFLRNIPGLVQDIRPKPKHQHHHQDHDDDCEFSWNTADKYYNYFDWDAIIMTVRMI
jgi:hypothetical protein